MQQVDARKTPMTVDDLVSGLLAGYRKVMGSEPGSGTLACLVAQACLESGNGLKLWNYNLGNVKRSPTWDGFWCSYGCDERGIPSLAERWIASGGRRTSVNADGTWTVWFDPPHRQTHFRAFANAAEGCAEFISFLCNAEGRYTKAWSAAAAGDAAGFVTALHAAGYFTANVDAYRKAVVSIARRVEAACVRALAGQPLAIDDATRSRVLLMVGATLADSLFATEPDRLEPVADVDEAAFEAEGAEASPGAFQAEASGSSLTGVSEKSPVRATRPARWS